MERIRVVDQLETEAAIRSILVNPELETGQMVGPVKEVKMYKNAIVGGQITFGWRKVRKGVKTPSRKNWKRVGWNCYAAENVSIKRGEREIVPLGVSIVHWPENTCGRFVSRMELSVFHGLEVGSVVIEPDYYDELKVVVFNHGVSTFQVKKGFKICQLVFDQVYSTPTFGLGAGPPARKPEALEDGDVVTTSQPMG
jgi:deoxyuridine 5'-triphosphate nucleotidohydrolase